MIQILQIIGCVLTAAIGAFSVFAPKRIEGFTGLSAQSGRGRTEIRAVVGGVFLALGVIPFFLGDIAFKVTGITYLVLGVIRLPSIFIDKSGTQSNWISLVSEIVLGVIFIL